MAYSENTELMEVIQITYAGVLSAIANYTLKPGKLYKVYDYVWEVGGTTSLPLVFMAISDHEISPDVYAGTTFSDVYYWTPSTTNATYPMGILLNRIDQQSEVTLTGMGVTASSAELNLLDGSEAGTAVASKALVLGTNKNVDTLVVADGGLKLGSGAGTAVTVTAAKLNKTDTASRLYNLGAPILAVVDNIVATADMKVGTYTVLTNPDVPRNLTVTHTANDAVDTLGTIDIVGTAYDDSALTETITPVNGTTVAGLKAFKTITSITGVNWVIDGTGAVADSISIGVGNVIGLPLAISATNMVKLAILGTAITAHTATAGVIGISTVDVSGGTYDGSKSVLVFIVD